MSNVWRSRQGAKLHGGEECCVSVHIERRKFGSQDGKREQQKVDDRAEVIQSRAGSWRSRRGDES